MSRQPPSPSSKARRVLLTGATGFVGRALFPKLAEAGHDVVCTSRRPDAAAERWPDRRWTRLDLADPATLGPALDGCDAAVYLVHSLGRPDFERIELEQARRFAASASRAGLERVVYLGGITPPQTSSAHLRSRAAVGAALAADGPPTFELRASMVVGPGSESWTIVRDLALRLPVMVLPRWMRNRTQPVASDDVAEALAAALSLPLSAAGIYDLPGPETLSYEAILRRIAGLRGTRPKVLRIPGLVPRLASMWIALVTRADPTVVSHLVPGLLTEILSDRPPFWTWMPGFAPTGLDEAFAAALRAEVGAGDVTPAGRLVERLAARVSASAREAA